jgi:hypothetical protein
MDKSLLDIINDFASWRGNLFTLAALLIAQNTELVKQRLIDAGFQEAADAL